MLVTKFGGSSLCNSENFLKVRNIITSDEERKVIVVSAPGKRFSDDTKITDLLLRCAFLARNQRSFNLEFANFEERFREITESCHIDLDLEEEFNEIYNTICETGDSFYAASRGEYLSAKVMASFLGFNFCDAKDVIFFNENGKVNEERTYEAIRNAYSEFGPMVIPGFYGSLPNGSIKTFSRGGSDITGSLAAAALASERYENWTDVSGILMADPRIVANPRPIESITYGELRELAHMGASVLHEDAVYPVMKENIPLNIRNTNRPEDKGTMVGNSFSNKNSVTGISGRRNFSVISVRTENALTSINSLAKIMEILNEADIMVENAVTNQEGFFLTISSPIDENGSMMNSIRNICTGCDVTVEGNLSLVSVVGENVNKASVCAYLMNVLAVKMINVEIINQIPNCGSVVMGVRNSDFEKTINTLYDEITAMAI